MTDAEVTPASPTDSDSAPSGLRRWFDRARSESASADPHATAIDRALFGGPATVGRYRLVARIGVGGFGVVHEGYDPALRRRVAIKLLHRAPGADALAREGQALARVRHPNVVQVFDVGVTDHDLFIVMELVRGEPLSSWLARGPQRSAVLEVMRAAGRGLAAVHACGLLHRDFKPSNVLVGADGTVKIVDFGLAELVQPDARPHTSAPRARHVAGTPLYMAPEQHHGRTLDHRADIYAFSLVLLEAVLGRNPLADASDVELPRAKRAETFTELLRQERLPPPVSRALARGLCADRRRRWSTMEDLLAALGPAPGQGTAITRRRLWAVAVPFVIALSVLPGAREDPCAGHGDAGDLRGAEDTRRALDQLGTDEASMGPVESGIVRHAVQWSSRWAEASARTCEGTAAHRIATRECLLRERAGFTALTSGLGPGSAPRARALVALADLPDPMRCVLRPRGHLEAPRDAWTTARIQLAHVHHYTGDLEALADDIQEIGPRSLTDDPELAAWLEYWQARIDGTRGDPDLARPRLERAYQAARVAHADTLAHRTALDLASYFAVVAVDLGRATEWLRVADAIAPKDPGVMTIVRRLRVDRRIAVRRGDYAAAVEIDRDVLARLEEAGLGYTPVAADVRNDILESELSLGRFEGLDAFADESLAIATETLGPTHRVVAEAHAWRGRLYAMTERPDVARRELERATEILQALGERLLLAQVGNTLGELATEAGDIDAAVAAYASALASLPVSERADRGITMLNLAVAEIFSSRDDDGRRHLQGATELLEESLGLDHPWTALAADAQAMLAQHGEDWLERARLSSHAAVEFTRHYGATNWMAAASWITAAKAEIEGGDLADAREMLALAERVEGAPPSLVEQIADVKARLRTESEEAR